MMTLSVMSLKKMQAASGSGVDAIPDEPPVPIQEVESVKPDLAVPAFTGDDLSPAMRKMFEIAVAINEKHHGAEHLEGFRRCVEETDQEIKEKKRGGETVALADEMRMLSNRWEQFSKNFLATPDNSAHLGDIFEIQGLIHKATLESTQSVVGKDAPFDFGATGQSVAPLPEKEGEAEITTPPPQVTSGVPGFSVFGGLGRAVGKGFSFPGTKVASGLRRWRTNNFAQSLELAQKSIEPIKRAVAELKACPEYGKAMQAKEAGNNEAYQAAINSQGYKEAEYVLKDQFDAAKWQFEKAGKAFSAVEQYGHADKDFLKKAASEFEKAASEELELLPEETKEQLTKMVEAIVKMVEAFLEKIGIRKKLAA